MNTSRRTFIRTLAPAVAVPLILPSCVWKKSPNEKLTMGFVGMGIQSRYLLSKFMPLVQVVGVCDVDTTRRTHAREAVDTFYTENPDKGSPGCKEFLDYQELIGMKDLDLVCIATPDHWHSIITLAALQAGKDVFCEKPLTHSIQEAVDVIRMVDRKKRVLQTGSMQRSANEFRIAAELIRNGRIGKIDRVEVSFSGPPVLCDLPEEEMEPGLDWNRWLGPAPMRPYNPILSPRGIHKHFPDWRKYREYGTGGVGDWGAHHIDIAQWGLGMDQSGPVEVLFTEGNATLLFSNGVPVIRKEGGYGVHFFGSEGEVLVNRGRFKMIYQGETIAEHPGGEGKETTCQGEVYKAEERFLKDAPIRLYKSTNHYEDFITCVRSRQKPVANEQAGGRTAICCHLMNQLFYHDTPFKWDPDAFRFTGGTGDPSWLGREYRKW